MKVQLTTNLDVHGLGPFDARQPADLASALIYLTNAFLKMEAYTEAEIARTMENHKDSPQIRDGLVRILEQEAALLKQVMDEARITGTVDTGDDFVFAHWKVSKGNYRNDLRIFPPADSSVGRGPSFIVLLPGQKLTMGDVYSAHQILEIQPDWKTFRYRKAINHHPAHELHLVSEIGLHFESYCAFLHETEWTQGWLKALEEARKRRPWGFGRDITDIDETNGQSAIPA